MKTRISPALVAGTLAFALASLASLRAEGAAPPRGDYLVGIEDRLSVVVWGEPDLSLQVNVRPDGKIAFPIKNMRFNESPVIMLNNIEALGKPERINGNLIPPMKIRDFTFSSLSDAV